MVFGRAVLTLGVAAAILGVWRFRIVARRLRQTAEEASGHALEGRPIDNLPSGTVPVDALRASDDRARAGYPALAPDVEERAFLRPVAQSRIRS
jgi:hypothetical protein